MLYLSITYKNTEKTINIGYIGFRNYRLAIAKAISQELYKVYEQIYTPCTKNHDWETFEKYTDNDIRFFLLHSDTDGYIHPKRSKRLYEKLSKLKLEWYQEFHEKFLELLKEASQNKKRIEFI